MSIAHIAVDYTEFKGKPSYRNVRVSIGRKEKPMIFATDDFPTDYINAVLAILRTKGVECSMLSSSVDHFVMDCKDRYQWFTNGVIGDYPVESKAARRRWHNFKVKSSDGKRAAVMSVLKRGNAVIMDYLNGKFRAMNTDGMIFNYGRKGSKRISLAALQKKVKVQKAKG